MDKDMTNKPDFSKNIAAGPGSTTPQDFVNRGHEAYDQTKRTVSEAYDKTSQALSGTYDQAMAYSRENPGRAVLIAFGVGIGIGMLLVGSSRRSPASRYGEPIVNALSNMAMDFIRRL